MKKRPPRPDELLEMTGDQLHRPQNPISFEGVQAENLTIEYLRDLQTEIKRRPTAVVSFDLDCNPPHQLNFLILQLLAEINQMTDMIQFGHAILIKTEKGTFRAEALLKKCTDLADRISRSTAQEEDITSELPQCVHSCILPLANQLHTNRKNLQSTLSEDDDWFNPDENPFY